MLRSAVIGGGARGGVKVRVWSEGWCGKGGVRGMLRGLGGARGGVRSMAGEVGGARGGIRDVLR